MTFSSKNINSTKIRKKYNRNIFTDGIQQFYKPKEIDEKYYKPIELTNEKTKNYEAALLCDNCDTEVPALNLANEKRKKMKLYYISTMYLKINNVI
mgnify:CR=1 FL=1